jgi:hypothetical protein
MNMTSNLSWPNITTKKAKFVGFILTLSLLLILSFGSHLTPVSAQTLFFSVPELRMQVFIQPDASARIVYDISFVNSPSGSVIDIVDIPTPHDNYDLNNMSASIDGVGLSDIRRSEFIDTGVEIHLHDQSIPPGEEATLHFEFVMPDMVYQDTTSGDLASFQIAPMGFEPEFLSGTTDIWLAVHMLPGIKPEAVLYQDVPFSDKILFEDHVVASWRWENGDLADPPLVGVSFPQQGLTRVIEQSLLDITRKWLEDNPTTRIILGGITLLLVGFAFFRFTGGTGLTVFVIITAGLVFLMVNSPLSVLLVLPLSIVVVGLNEYGISRRKTRYLPAIAQVEGGGIKRGLTAPEAAIILELPLNKVLTLIIFGLLEKGIVSQTNESPLTVQVAHEFRAPEKKAKIRREHRLKVAQNLGIVVRSYEHPFLDLIEDQAGEPVHKIDFSQPMKKLIQHTAERMKGFDLSDTQDYYKKVIARAMNEAKQIGEIPERERYLDRHLQWLLLDDAYPTVFTTRRYHYRPIWVRPFASSDRIGGPTFSPSQKGAPSGPSYGGRTSVGDVAASFAGWTENTMGDLASSIAPGALQVKGEAGLVNLSGVDKVTGNVFKALSTSSGGGSSSGGGCACACAGCACACACAGGGR